MFIALWYIFSLSLFSCSIVLPSLSLSLFIRFFFFFNSLCRDPLSCSISPFSIFLIMTFSLSSSLYIYPLPLFTMSLFLFCRLFCFCLYTSISFLAILFLLRNISSFSIYLPVPFSSSFSLRRVAHPFLLKVETAARTKETERESRVTPSAGERRKYTRVRRFDLLLFAGSVAKDVAVCA